MRKITADWIFTLATEPLKNGVVILDNQGTILDLLPNAQGLEEVEKLNGVLCPGFINAHCHLELSHLRDRLPQKTGLVTFIKNVQQFRNAADEEVLSAIEKAETEMIANGIVAVGDISNSSISFSQKQKSNLRYHTFVEVFGFNPESAEAIIERANNLLRAAPQTASVTPHAPYSVSEKLFKLISNSELSIRNPQLLSIHNQETIEETKFFEDKSGEFLDLYKTFGLDISFFQSSGKTSLQTYLPWLGQAKTLLVHNTFSSQQDIDFAKARGENYFCLCPNANLFIEDALPDMQLLMKNQLPLVIGTDSLSSNTSLSILDELKTLQHHFLEINLISMLNWACKNGARFFGWDDLGTIEKGKRPGLNLIQNLENLSRADEVKLTAASSVKPIKLCKNYF
ncbi:amidohydrolase family protein [Solitalea koreensis]|uniref:Cytosine/adenosine deaminase n=1 Tax=Solitalea koreensis TaxID=543615 RepID=A0A521CRB0_9SPHI|nr:amidohydrolase family protein [Solitalea koreensis]SMO61994.1 Cytosine/adenosine deaminase [Solitalea koreensis]